MENEFQCDTLYAKSGMNMKDFIFDEYVVEVFDDMIQRSVPGYNAIIYMIGCLAEKHVQSSTLCYDLGCSLGSATISMRQRIDAENVHIVAVDNSDAMIEKCRIRLNAQNSSISFELQCCDIQKAKIVNASVAVLNFTLQFIPVEERKALISQIYQGLQPGGIIILSEKIFFEDPGEQQLQTELYHTFKKINGYSDLEISQKRSALEDILIPETLNEHRRRLSEAGFSQINVWFQCFNFMSLVAVK